MYPGGEIMMRTICIATTLLCALLIFGCAANNANQAAADDNDLRQQIEDEFGALTDEQIEGFEREIQSQYVQLQRTYEQFDEAQNAAGEGDHDQHRLHRKLKRRHQTLARLHEDRLWLNVNRGRNATQDDRRLAEAHRSAARWHEQRFQDNGVGVEDQDSELEVIRDQLQEVMR